MNTEGIVDSIMDLIQKDLIAKTFLTADAVTGDTTVSVINSFYFVKDQEIIFIDYGYNDTSSVHYQKFEYAVVKEVIDTTTISLRTPVISNWLVSNTSFVQKTIGHKPLYTENVYYGDREVIPTDDIAITVEPVSLSNDWIYLQGGLDEDTRVTVRIYGQETKTENGMRILSKYTDATYQLLNDNMHLNINDYQTPILHDIAIGDTQFCVCDNEENRENFVVSTDDERYSFQDNKTPRCMTYCIGSVTISGGEICLELDAPFQEPYTTGEFAVAGRMKRYIYDSRADGVTFGSVQKGSAFLRASEISWFGKEVNDHSFPQFDKRVPCFDADDPCATPTD